MHTPGQTVVVVGAGFGGIEAARTLARNGIAVLLIDRQSHHLFTPLLHQVAMAEIEPDQIGISVRRLLRSFHTRQSAARSRLHRTGVYRTAANQSSPQVQFLQAEVRGIDPDQQILDTTAGIIPFRFLILASGSSSSAPTVAGAVQHTLPLKTLSQAIALRNHILACVEQAVQEPDPLRRQSLLTFTVIGGGSTGVEVTGSLAEWMREGLSKDYPMLQSQFRLVLLHRGDRLLETMDSRLSRYSEKQLKRLGVQVRLQSDVVEVESGRIRVRTGDLTVAAARSDRLDLIETGTIIWAGGIRVNVPDSWQLPTAASGRVKVSPSLNLFDHSQIYAIGDLAEAFWQQQPLPMLAPTAVAQGKTAAQNILRQLCGQNPLPYQHVDRGTMAILSRFHAVVQRGKFTMTGFPAWLLWLGFHWLILPGIRQRILVLIHWIFNHLRHDRIPAAVIREAEDRVPAKNTVHSFRSP